MEIRIKIPWPDDPAQRAMVVAIIASILLHLVLIASLISINTFGTPSYLKRGEPLLVDIAPDKPEEKAPLGNPARRVGPESEKEAPEPPAPKPMASAPPAPAPRPTPAPKAAMRPAPEPPKQVAKAEPPRPAPRAPEPPASTPYPEPAPKVAEPQPPNSSESDPRPAPSRAAPAQTADAPKGMVAPPAVPPGSSGEQTGQQTALAKPSTGPSPGIFRHPPGGGGGLRGGRGGVDGEPIPLDTPEPKYQDYFNKIREKIKANWIYPREAGDRGLQ